MHHRIGRFVPVLLIGARFLFGGTASITIDAAHPGATISRNLYGIFFEEINHAGDGGLYAELIRDRGFEDANLPPACVLKGHKLIPPRTPHFWTQPKVSDWTMDWEVTSQWPGWSTELKDGASAQFALVTDHPLTAATPHAFRAQIEKLPHGASAAVINEGYWGIAVKAGEQYRLNFWARTETTFHGPFRASLRGSNGANLVSQAIPKKNGTGWQHYELVLCPNATDATAKFVLSFGSTGTVWLDFVSLFPARTFHNRPNGMRPDIAQMIADMKPAFLRFPGGCYVEGITVQSRPQWKATLGRPEDRVPTFSPWGYWSTNGLGYHEFLQFSEDIGADALYVANAGISCAFRSGTFIPDDQMQPLIQDTLDAIEYAIGPVDSKWGALRAKAGHPAPFPLKYIEIGNEDEGSRYGERFARFYQAIKAKYPQMNVVLDSWIAGIDWRAIHSAGKFDLLDEHSYRPLYWSFTNFDHFAQYKRGAFDLYIGEFATNSGVGHGNLAAALGDAAYMMSMEANADLVKMGSYAPLLENVNKPDWDVNLIHFDASRVFGRASYYMCRLFAENRPDTMLPTRASYNASQEKPIAGPIGLGTYNTSAEFKDIRVESDGHLRYQSDFATDSAKGWQPQADTGEWAIKAGAYVQKNQAVAWTYFGNAGLKNVTISLKARKRAGREGFVVVLGKADGRRIEWNVGGFENHLHAVEADDEVLGNPVHASIEAGRWYNVKVEVNGRKVRCFLDGNLVSDVTVPEVETVLAVSGRDKRTGEIVLKALNTAGERARTSIAIEGDACVSAKGRLIQLTSTAPQDENSFAEPDKIVPVTREVDGLGQRFEATLPPWSLSVFRIPANSHCHAQ